MNQTIDFLKSQIGMDARNSPSPLMRWLNPVMLSAEPGELALRYEVRREWLNPAGNLHGGIMAAIVDDAIGAAVFSLGEAHFYATINNCIDYLGSSQEGQQVIARASVVKKGRQLINAQCEVWNGDDTRLLAKGYSNLIKTDTSK